MAWYHCIRQREWTKEEMENTVCTCPETGHPDEFGDGSSLPCMEIDSELRCCQCTWCKLRKE